MTAPDHVWVDAYTTRTGMPDPRLTGTTAKPRHCTTCGRLVLAGYDSPACADLAITDPYTLTPTLEAAAVILGRPTWQLWGAPSRYELTARTPARLLGVRLVPADRCVVVATHHRSEENAMNHLRHAEHVLNDATNVIEKGAPMEVIEPIMNRAAVLGILAIAEALQALSAGITTRVVDVVLDGPPGPISGRFVETETPDGRGTKVGSWIERPDGCWALRLTIAEAGA